MLSSPGRRGPELKISFTLFFVQSRLESKLCKLYKNMLCLKETLQNKRSSTTSVVLTSHHISQPIRERLTNHVTTVSDMLRDCSKDLLCLSVLYPAAPWVRKIICLILLCRIFLQKISKHLIVVSLQIMSIFERFIKK